MLGDITQARDIYIACGYMDMRKSIDGLAAIVQQNKNGECCISKMAKVATLLKNLPILATKVFGSQKSSLQTFLKSAMLVLFLVNNTDKEETEVFGLF